MTASIFQNSVDQHVRNSINLQPQNSITLTTRDQLNSSSTPATPHTPTKHAAQLKRDGEKWAARASANEFASTGAGLGPDLVTRPRPGPWSRDHVTSTRGWEGGMLLVYMWTRGPGPVSARAAPRPAAECWQLPWYIGPGRQLPTPPEFYTVGTQFCNFAQFSSTLIISKLVSI